MRKIPSGVAAVLISAAALSAAPSTAAATERTNADDWLKQSTLDLGYKISNSVERGSRVSEVGSTRTGITIRTISSRAGTFESREELAPGGALRERVTHQADGTTLTERFFPRYSTTLDPPGDSDAQACRVAEDLVPAGFDFIKGLTFNSTQHGDGVFDLGSNVIADSSCKGYIDQIKRSLANIGKGLRCLQDNGLDAVAAKVFTLYSTYPHPVAITCTHGKSKTVVVKYYDKIGKIDHVKPWELTGVAMGNYACRDKFPVIAVDVSRFDSGYFDPARTSAFFHESLHLAGYAHNELPDLPYLSYFCCFDNFDGPTDKAERARLRAQACGAMTRTYNASAGPGGCDRQCQSKYFSDFGTLMSLDGLSPLAFESAWKNLDKPLWNYGALAAVANAVIAAGGTNHHGYLTYIMGSIGEKSLTVRAGWRAKLGVADDGPQRKIADVIAGAARMRARIESDGLSAAQSEYAELLEALRDPALQSCDGLSVLQKVGVRKALDIVGKYVSSPAAPDIEETWPNVPASLNRLKEACR